MTERKFTKALGKPGMAAQLRETVSQVVRETAVQSKPALVEPLDFETFVLKNKTVLQNDPQRELLLYPTDDVSQVVLPRKYRTVTSNVPSENELSGCGLLVRECVKSYSSNWNVIHYKYSAYSGSYLSLRKVLTYDDLNDEVYEVDSDIDPTTEAFFVPVDQESVSKQGVLLGGQETAEGALANLHSPVQHSVSELPLSSRPRAARSSSLSPSIFPHMGGMMRSFKRRHCLLRREPDGTHVLRLYKDENRSEVKATIVVDLCSAVVQNPSKGPLCFEILSSAGGSLTLAAESDTEMYDWISKLSSVISRRKKPGDVPLEKRRISKPALAKGNQGSQTNLDSLRIRYSCESDVSIALARRENRRGLFTVHPFGMGKEPAIQGLEGPSLEEEEEEEANVEPYCEHFGHRVLVHCKSLRFRLRAAAPLQGSGDQQVEPYFTSLALFDAKQGRKISETFYFDVNGREVVDLLPPLCDKLEDDVDDSKTTASETIPEDWALSACKAIFSVHDPHPEVYLVVRIEKVLQGGTVAAAAEPYVRSAKGSDPLLAPPRLLRTVQSFCQRLGYYRMPFAWSARPLFITPSCGLDTVSEFPVIYRQDVGKMSDDDLLKVLADFKKPEKMSRWTVIPGCIELSIEPFSEPIPNSLSCSMVPLKPFPSPPTHPASVEVMEFDPSTPSLSLHPHTSFLHNAYISPKSLRFEAQRTFARARNISCTVEIRDSDKEGALPLKCIYGRPSCQRNSSLWTARVTCPVVHHSTNPIWYEEVKVRLPVCLQPSHHVLFTFHHVPCEAPRRRVSEGGEASDRTSIASSISSFDGSIVPVGNCVGYSWIPLSAAYGVEEHCLPVATSLPPAYLSLPQTTNTTTATTNVSDFAWVDGKKPIFSVFVRVASTVSSPDQHLNNVFELAESLSSKPQAEACRILKEAQAISIPTAVLFLPTLFNQLFRLLLLSAYPPSSENKDVGNSVGLAVLRLIVHLVHELLQAGHSNALYGYLKYVFLGPAMSGIEGEQTCSPSHLPSPIHHLVSANASLPTVHEELSRHLPVLLRPANTDSFVINHFMLHSRFFFGAMIKSMAQHLLSTGRIKMHRNERFSSDYLYRVQSLLQVLCPLVTQKHSEMADETSELNKSIAFFLKRCLSFMDRGYVFRLINGYVGRFNPGDPPSLCAYKFTFLRILCSHEHYVALNLPLDVAILSATMRGSSSSSVGRTTPSGGDEESESVGPVSQSIPSETFCQYHFLAGLLQREVRSALLEGMHVRSTALSVLRQLLTKHELDERYQTKGRLSRIAALYEPWLTIMLENVGRLEEKGSGESTGGKGGSLGRAVTVVNGMVDDREWGRLMTHQQQQPSPMDSPILAAISRGSRGGDLAALHAGVVNGLVQGESGDADSPIPLATPSAVEFSSSGSQGVLRAGHSRSPSGMIHLESLSPSEVHDMLLCFLFVIKHLGEEKLVAWWSKLSENELLNFFHILEICLHRFRYQGRRHIEARSRTDLSDVARSGPTIGREGGRAMTLPARVQPPTEASLSSIGLDGGLRRGGGSGGVGGIPFKTEVPVAASRKCDPIYQALLEANVATEVGLVVLDALGLFCTHGGSAGAELPPVDGPILQSVFGVHLSFLRVGQSETLLGHVFAALRAFADNFSPAIFKGSTVICGQLCHELLRCCGSRLSTTRTEACTLLYLLMRGNFKFTAGKSIMRIHTQVMVAVSKMLSAGIATLDSANLRESLGLIDDLAERDLSVRGTGFPREVADLTKRVKTVLATMARMREHGAHDPEMLADMQHSLASSYASTPQLRHAWLHSMAMSHQKNDNLSEGAMCQLHVAALISQFLKQQGLLSWGAESFALISSNIAIDEKGPELDTGSVDASYSEDSLLKQVELCAEWIRKAERYELLGPLYRLVLPIYEKRRQYDALATAYSNLALSCNKIIEVERSGRRLLGTYFRVAFYGRASPWEKKGVEYVYHEPKVTPLAEISERLRQQHSERYGADSVRLGMESQSLDPETLDPKLAHIQVTHVVPYFERPPWMARVTSFDRHHDIRHFVFETPFVEGGGGTHSEELHLQWKKRTILTMEYSFPYMKKRILVVERREERLSPIEVALDEMRMRVAELQEVVSSSPIDAKKLQLRLQGSVCVQVNAGPLAYAKAFLDPSRCEGSSFPEDKLDQLREAFVEFLKVCSAALKLNAGIVSSDRYEYQKVLSDNFKRLVRDLHKLTDGVISHASGYDSPVPTAVDEREPGDIRKRNSRLLFGMIGGASIGSSTA
ncbi:dedicator of cytokinesis protein 9 [Ischnura elegans]|uniref:dedicator of cytokinesis protein 9 n=1 Tax=Ischnura elegans TaxID=197161 RepID=UPI001ED8B17C|nr:dedicator of cytokinesis protein 9 [Ischnura elegans]